MVTRHPTPVPSPLRAAGSRGKGGFSVARPRPHTVQRRARRGAMITELIVAMAIIVLALIPLATSLFQEQKLLRASYHKAVAMELIDGEMEILLAGEWREFKPGAQPYPLPGLAATNLPPGGATLTITGNRLRLEWLPEDGKRGARVVREGVGR